ncbi:MAG: iron ABC transporter permease [Pseudomonadota bacterium]
MNKETPRVARAGQVRLWIALACAAGGLALVPLVSVVAALFQGGGAGVFAHLFATILPAYAFNTALLMALVGGLSALIGVGTAWLVSASAFPGRRLWSWVLVLPIAAPAYIIAYLYTDFLTYSGPVQSALRDLFGWQAGEYWFPEVRSLPGAALMLSLVLYPYVYLLARASFSAQSRSQFLAARALGLSPTQALFRVAIPGARLAIFGGVALVLMETLADFGVADYFAIPTFSTGIFRTWFALGDRQAAMQLAGVMLIFVIALVATEAATRRGQVVSADRFSAGSPPLTLSSGHALLANLACAVPVILGFLIPVILLVINVMSARDQQSLAAFTRFISNSVGTAVVTAGLATALAIVLAYAARSVSRNDLSGYLIKAGVRLSTLGYALPGALLAVGLLGPLGLLDQSLTRVLRDTAGWNGGLILTGTAALLIYALIVRFLTVSFNSVTAGMAKISPSVDAAARSLGASPTDLVRRVHVPLLGPQLGVSASLVFVDVMRELPATLILRPFNFETLATRVYRLASDERIVEASTAALIIVLVGLVPVFVLNMQTKTADHG